MFFSSENMNNRVFQRGSLSGDNPISMFGEFFSLVSRQALGGKKVLLRLCDTFLEAKNEIEL